MSDNQSSTSLSPQNHIKMMNNKELDDHRPETPSRPEPRPAVSSSDKVKILLDPRNHQRPSSQYGPIDDEDITINLNRPRRLTRTSFAESDANSHGSRTSQETEEDVCFPMHPEHIRINGIDFDEIEEFIQDSRIENETLRKEVESSSESIDVLKSSVAAEKYTPRDSDSNNGTPGVSFGNNKMEGQEIPPDRFSFFCSESDETIHAPDITSLVKPGESIKSLFKSGQPTWWLDCICPTDSEMKVLAKAFGIHPLTAEDIRMQETREKVELFHSYYFVCFHTFESDKESEEFLEPIKMYIVVFREGVLSFHFNEISHAANVRRRVRQLRDYVDVSADWLCYALIDDITDSFAPAIHGIEHEADAIEDQVFLTKQTDFSLMLQKIGESRRKVMTLMRLLSGKADVIKMFAKRCQDEVVSSSYQQSHGINGHSQFQKAQPRADIALYLGDIQDHVVTMYQNLSSYEKIFSRSHSNYLAQLQVESFNSNNKSAELLSKVSLIGTVLVPMNLVTGLFGMNVTVPGQNNTNLAWFFGILGGIIIFTFILSYFANWWMSKSNGTDQSSLEPESGRLSILNFGRRRSTGPIKESRSIYSHPSPLDRYD